MNDILDLQRFAVQTTTTKGSGNDLTPEMKTYYEKRLIDLAEPRLVHDQFGDKYPIPQNGGKIIEFRKYSPLAKALTPLTEGVTPSGNSLNVTAVTAVTAVRTSLSNIFLSVERHSSVAAVACFYVNFNFIYYHIKILYFKSLPLQRSQSTH